MNVKINNLFDWIKKEGGFIHPNVSHTSINNISKLILSEKMGGKGVNIISIPEKLKITGGDYLHHNFDTSSLTDIEMEYFNQPFFKLIVNLINEKLKGKKSYYYPFISTLPSMESIIRDYKNPIFFYSESQIKKEWEKILPSIIFKLDNLNSFYINIHVTIEKLDIFNINTRNFPGYDKSEDVLKTLTLWAFLIVNNFALEKTYLLPLFNLMHYTPDTENKMILDDKNRINFNFCDIESNEISINNGILDNETLYSLYGYINFANVRYLEIKLSEKYKLEDETVRPKVEETFEKHFDRKVQKYYLSEKIPSPSLIQYLRILSLSERDLHIIEGDKEYFTKFISMDNEIGVYKKLLKIVRKKHEYLKKHDTSNKPIEKVSGVRELKVILKEQIDIVKSIYYQICQKWVNILEEPYPENGLKSIFKLE